jgi:hypothetical protein
MPDKGSETTNKALNAVVGAATAFVVRKALNIAWTKVTGHEPPGKADDPDVNLGEALAWTVAVGAGVAVARVLAMRFTNRHMAKRLTGPAE